MIKTPLARVTLQLMKVRDAADHTALPRPPGEGRHCTWASLAPKGISAQEASLQGTRWARPSQPDASGAVVSLRPS